jgi:hypothetical protein
MVSFIVEAAAKVKSFCCNFVGANGGGAIPVSGGGPWPPVGKIFPLGRFYWAQSPFDGWEICRSAQFFAQAGPLF